MKMNKDIEKKDNNKKALRKNGFTLIELLAVIVVLSIVMLIAATAVLPRMAEARKQVFALEANSAIEAAQTYFTNNSLSGDFDAKTLPVDNGGTTNVKIGDLITGGFFKAKTDYVGCVTVTKSGNIYTYKISMTNGKLNVKNAGNGKDVATDDVTDGSNNITDSCAAPAAT